MLKKKKIYLITVAGFATIILIGSLLLISPICLNYSIDYKEALFTSVSAVTTTGLLNVDISQTFTFYGQLVIAMLMNIGAVGFIIFIALIWIIKDRRINLSEMQMISESISENNYQLIKEGVKVIIKYMFIIETIGTFLYSIKFIPQYGIAKGIWYSIFTSISAFSNTGVDLFGTSGFINYNKDIFIVVVTIFLMLMGSIGILNIKDFIDNRKKRFEKLRFQSKIIYIYLFILTIFPALLLVILEKGKVNFINGLFLSTTAHSTGFSTIAISEITDFSKFLLIITMFIGGAPGSTAGGIRVSVFAVLLSTIVSTLKGEKNVNLFNRKIDEITIRKAILIFFLFLVIILIATGLLAIFNNFGMLNIVFECTSAITTTGLSTVNQSVLNPFGEWLVMLLMFIGRIGPLPIIMLFVNEKKQNPDIEYPNAKLNL